MRSLLYVRVGYRLQLSVIFEKLECMYKLLSREQSSPSLNNFRSDRLKVR